MEPRRKLRALAGVALGTVLAVIGLEFGARLIDRVRGKPWSAEASRLAIERTCQMLTRISEKPAENLQPHEAVNLERRSILNPYTGWEERITQRRIAEDAAYFRTEEGRSTCDVLVLGGSVAYFFAEQGGEIVSRTVAESARFRGRTVRVHNYALGGYKQPQPAMALATLLAYGHEPDVVIEVDGFNESAIGWGNARTGSHPIYPSTTHWTSATNGMSARPEMVEVLHEVRATQDRAREFAEWFLRSGLWKSCFLDHVGSLMLERRRRTYVAAYEKLTAGIRDSFRDDSIVGPAFDVTDAGIAEAIVTAWVEGSVTMRGLCARRGIAFVHVLQPTLHDAGSKPLTAKEIEVGTADPNWIEGVQKVYPELRAAGARLAARGVEFFDGSRAFAQESGDLYYDTCHFGERGNEVLAQAVAEPLLRACSVGEADGASFR